jgi:hypothetical protein
VNGFELVAGVIIAFFVCGILLGVLAVIALGRLDYRPRRRYRRLGRYGIRPTEPSNQVGWEEPPGPDDNEGPPPWPERRG